MCSRTRVRAANARLLFADGKAGDKMGYWERCMVR